MGCISSKEESKSSPKERVSRKGSSDNRRVAHVSSIRRDERARSKDKLEGGDVKKLMSVDKKTAVSKRSYDDQAEKKRVETHVEKLKVGNFDAAVVGHPQFAKKKTGKSDVSCYSHPAWGRVSKSLEAEQVAAGWPSWLASVAGEAIKGWVPRHANTFEKLDRIGQGTYSNVYKARDLTHDKIVAIKKVRFDYSDLDSVKFMAREIIILRRLDHRNVIKLEGLITSNASSSVYLIFEYMEHDLTGLVSLPGIKFTESQIKCYMQQLLSGLDHCHSHGVLHRDIKGSNLLIDSNGILKLADFGLASFFDPQSSAQLTSRVVTLWYRAPELLLGTSKYGVAVDLWSTGCILGELYAGKPILPGRTEVEQLHKIYKLCGTPDDDYWEKLNLPRSSAIKPQWPYRRCIAETFKDLPSSAAGLIENLLSLDPAQRGTADFALKSEYFTSKPYACDPSSLPKYPPSKEIDAKKRDEEARSRVVVGSERKELQAIQLSNARPGFLAPMQRRKHSNSNVGSEMFNSRRGQTVSGFLVDPSKQSQDAKEQRRDFLEHQQRKVSHSGPLVHGTAWTKAGKDLDNPRVVSARTNLSTMSGLVATRTALPEDRQARPSASQLEVVKQAGRFQGSINGLELRAKQDQHQHREEGGRKSNVGEPGPYRRGPRGNRIYLSGPLLVASNNVNVEQMLKEHDRQIQEFARRQLDKNKLGKMNGQGKQSTENSTVVARH